MPAAEFAKQARPLFPLRRPSWPPTNIAAAAARGDAEDAPCTLLAGKKSQEDDDWEDIWEVLW